MIYPVKSSDLAGHLVDDDYIATLIVIESCLTDNCETLDFSDPKNKDEIIKKVKQWEKYPEIVNTINKQKELINPFEDRVSSSQVEELSSKVFKRYRDTVNASNKMTFYSKISVAACILFVLFGISLILTSPSNTSNMSVKNTASKTESPSADDQTPSIKPQNEKSYSESGADIPSTSKTQLSSKPLKSSVINIETKHSKDLWLIIYFLVLFVLVINLLVILIKKKFLVKTTR
ncbi:MAG: hypothetical protein U0R17_07770 [Acidimicrobiia bacterium]